MNEFDERIKKLQSWMRKDGLKAYLIPATDPHLSEEACPRFTYPRFYFCSFKGNDGTLLVTEDSYYLYTDGRYWVEAEEELENTGCTLVRAGKAGVPSIQEFVRENNLYPLGLDASLFSMKDLSSFYIDSKHPIVSISYASRIPDTPSLPKEKIWKLDPSLLSTTMEERVNALLEQAKRHNGQELLFTNLDDISYILGYRGNDIACTPVFYSYLFIENDGLLHLFIDRDKLPQDFFEPKIVIHPYDSIYDYLSKRTRRIVVDLKTCNARLVKHIKNPVNVPSLALRMKAVKKEVEIRNTKEVHEIDGIAVLRLQKYIEDNIDNDLDEYKLARYIDKVRMTDERCFEPSFETIAAVDSNAAMMHYAPSQESASKVTSANQLLLVDSGGQYYGGTTDITRTFLLNPKPSEEVRHDYTLTLKSQIALSRTVFEKGCSGHSIDITAREVMWKEGLDYKCGTGHGVSYIGPVHEGPIGFRYYNRPGVIDDGILEPGHIITIEPGVYKDHKHGIRLENELLVVPAFENEQGIFYRFETITYCPYDRKGIDLSMMSDSEIEWLNDYLRMVEEKLSKHLANDKPLLKYLKQQCAPFKR